MTKPKHVVAFINIIRRIDLWGSCRLHDERKLWAWSSTEPYWVEPPLLWQTVTSSTVYTPSSEVRLADLVFVSERVCVVCSLRRGMSRRERASVILLLPADTACLQRWMWWNCWWGPDDRHIECSYEKVLIRHQRVALKREPILPHSDSFLSLRVSSPCTRSCNSHIMSQRYMSYAICLWACLWEGKGWSRNVVYHTD